MLLPLANLATEIMIGWKGRLRAVTVVDFPGNGGHGADEEENKKSHGEEEAGSDFATVRILLGWRDVPYMRELLRVSEFNEWLASSCIVI
jgi:hypothetical protein